MSLTSDRAARQARIERYADATARRVDDAERAGGMGDTPDSRLRVIIKNCGYVKRTALVLKEISEVLRTRGIITNPPISDPTLKLDQRISFYRSPEPAPPATCRFPNERSLEDFVVMNFGRIRALHDLNLVKRQYKLPMGQRYAGTRRRGSWSSSSSSMMRRTKGSWRSSSPTSMP